MVRAVRSEATTGMQLDDLTPDQARRFRLWSALTEIERAGAAGHVTTEQVALLDDLADNLRTLAGQLAELAERSRELLGLARPTELPPADA